LGLFIIQGSDHWAFGLFPWNPLNLVDFGCFFGRFFPSKFGLFGPPEPFFKLSVINSKDLVINSKDLAINSKDLGINSKDLGINSKDLDTFWLNPCSHGPIGY
jgi:hypothetical protein